MNLTEHDIEIAETLTTRLNARNKASTVSAALAITDGIMAKIEDGGELMIRKKNGDVETVFIAGVGRGAGDSGSRQHKRQRHREAAGSGVG